MLIKKLTLENFRQFKDKETIEFSRKKDANITLILGDNTSGKTTILQAFLWCLYGNKKITFKSKRQLYNEEIAEKMQEGDIKNIKVEMEVNHSSTDYIISRQQQCIKTKDSVKLIGRPKASVYYKTEDNQTAKVKEEDTEEIIKDILPFDLSEYFFYDTERFGNITEKKDVTDSVKGLLGLKLLENAVSHLGKRTNSNSVIGKLFNDLNHEGNTSINKLHDKVNEFNIEIEKRENLVKIGQENIRNYEKNLKELEKQLRASENTRNIQKEIDRKREELKNITENEKRLRIEFLKEFKRDTLNFFMRPLLKETYEFIDRTDISEDFIPGMHADSIHNIIERGVCVCGTRITSDSYEYQNLQSSLKVIPPHSIGMLVDKHKALVRSEINRKSYLYDSINSKFKNIVSNRQRKNDTQSFIDRKSEEIKGLDDGYNLQNKIDEIRGKINENYKSTYKNEAEIDRYKKDIKEIEKEISKYLQINEQNEEILTLLKYAENVRDWFDKDLKKQQMEIRSALEKKVNFYFKRIYHGNRGVSIDDTYKVILYDRDNKNLITDESAGLETVKNFSFIAGLVELAKEKMEENNKRVDRVVIDEEYPLVLDAPFSNVDEKHVINISNVLPTVTGQLILIVMEKDWNYAAKELILKVGKTYRLRKRSEIYTTIEEE